MQIFHRRPLAFALFLFLLTVAFSYYLPKAVKLWGTALLVSLILVALGLWIWQKFRLRIKKRGAPVLLLVLSAFFVTLGLFSSYQYFDRHCASYLRLADTTAEIEATVTRVTYTSGYACYYEIKVHKIDGQAADAKMKLETAYACDLREDDRFVMQVVFADMAEDIDGYAEKKIALSKGFVLNALSETADYQIVGAAGFDLARFLKQINAAMSDRLEKSVPGETGKLLSAFFLGNRALVSDRIAQDFGRVGISHILSVSGMHFSVLAGGLEFLLNLFGLRKKRRSSLIIVFALFYMGLTGFVPPVTRAGIMLVLVHIAHLLGRERDALTSLFAAAALICLFSPYAVLDPSLWLSFFSTFGIVVANEGLAPVLDRMKRRNLIGKIGGTVLFNLAVTFAATLAVLPLIWLYFGEISLLAPLSNLILTPIADLFMYAAPLFLLLGRTVLLSDAMAFLGELFFRMTRNLSSWRHILLSLRYDFTVYLILSFVLVMFVLLTVKLKRRVWLAVVPAVFFIALCGGTILYQNHHAHELTVIYQSAKKNESLIVLSGGRALLCDISDGSYGIAAKSANTIGQNAVCEIETYMLTHYHQRHKSTLARLAQREYIRQLLLPTPQTEGDAGIAADLSAIAAEYNIPILFYTSEDDSLLFGQAQIDVMPRSMLSRSTHPLIALTIAKGERRVTYIGASAFEGAGSDFCGENATRSDVLILGIHGPVYKKPYFLYGFATGGRLSSVLYANDEVFSWHEESDRVSLAEIGTAAYIAGVTTYKIKLD